MIFAVDNAGAIGFENRLPWPTNKTDIKHFSGLTNRKTVLKGHNTWDSLPSGYALLPNRHRGNIPRYYLHGREVRYSEI